MADIEKVIKGLEICGHSVISQENCMECPYIYDGRSKQSNCEGVLHLDALSLLKEQEGTIKELQNAYDYLQKQFFEAQDELLKEQETELRNRCAYDYLQKQFIDSEVK